MAPAVRSVLIWVALAAAIVIPLWAAAQSPFLAWREPVYILAGFAGILGLALMLVQPLLAAGYLPGLKAARGRHVHRWIGVSLLVCVVLHVVGLWLTSPPDVIDALLLRSPTPFSIWGVIAMRALFATALLALLRRRVLSLRVWRLGHGALAVLIVGTTVLHAALIEGTMGMVSKAGLSVLALAATIKATRDLKTWRWRKPSR